MSYFDDASLVMIPSGYKTSKVYSVKPTDGTGDLAFTRSNDTATRVGPDGLIEKVRTNLLLQSQAFDNAAWTNDPTSGSITVTANYGTAPDGTQTADRIQITRGASYSQLYQSVSVASGSTYTISVYLKSLSGTPNITTIYTTSPTGTQTLTSEWARYTFSFSAPASAVYPMIGLFGANSATCDILAWGFQMETGDIATPYIATTTAAVSVGPVANVPRLDYLNSSCPRLLLEPQRTNDLQYSESFNNAYWTKSNCTISSNTTATLDPSGNNGADKLVEDSSNDAHVVYTSITGTSGNFSFFAKAAERSWVSVLTNSGSRAYFNLSNGTLGTIPAGSTASITPYGNGWYRCVIFNTHGSFGASIYLATANDVSTYAGNGTNGVFIYGAQFEAAAYATSYIPTLGASVTRGADAAYKASISTLIGQTEGVAFIDFVWNGLTGVGNYPRIIELATDSNNYIQLYSIAGTTSWGWDIYNGGVVQFTGGSTMALGRNKIAIGYKLNDMVVYKNGALVASDTSCTVPATSALGVAGSYIGSAAQLAASVNQTLLFKTRLTNAQLAELTTI